MANVSSFEEPSRAMWILTVHRVGERRHLRVVWRDDVERDGDFADPCDDDEDVLASLRRFLARAGR